MVFFPSISFAFYVYLSFRSKSPYLWSPTSRLLSFLSPTYDFRSITYLNCLFTFSSSFLIFWDVGGIFVLECFDFLECALAFTVLFYIYLPSALAAPRRSSARTGSSPATHLPHGHPLIHTTSALTSMTMDRPSHGTSALAHLLPAPTASFTFHHRHPAHLPLRPITSQPPSLPS